MSKPETRYFLFNRNTLSKTGRMTSVKNVDTREVARDVKRTSPQNLGIFDRWNNQVVY